MKITSVIVFTRITWKTALYIHKPIYIYKLFNGGWFLGVMIDEDMQIFSGSQVMRTIAIGRFFLYGIFLKMEI